MDLLHLGVRQAGARKTALGGPARDGAARKAVLIAEDSITSRMLLKNVLEAAGYYVRPTVDGVDALAALREEEFDLVVSDIEMPRMDGFELTRKIRATTNAWPASRWSWSPPSSLKKTESGVSTPAPTPTCTKSSFTQGTLLKTARSLL